MQQQAKMTPVVTVKKKPIFMNFPFKGDATADYVTRRLYRTIGDAFNAASLRITFTTNPVIRIRIKDNLPPTTASMCIYSFTCSCGARYIGRTSRRLATRIREHNPRWLAHGMCKNTRSAILNHLLDSNHRITPQESFKVIFRVP